MQSIPLLSTYSPLLSILTIFASIILILSIWKYRSYRKRKKELEQLLQEKKDIHYYVDKFENLNHYLYFNRGYKNIPKELKEDLARYYEIAHARAKSQNFKIIVNVEIDKDFDKFTYSDALVIITEIEVALDKSNIKFKNISRGSTILSIKLDYEDALKLLKLIQEERFKELGIKDIKVQKFALQENIVKVEKHEEVVFSVSDGTYEANNNERDLGDFISQMKENLTTNIEKALLLTKAKIKENSSKFNDIIMVTGKFNRLKEDLIKGIIDKNDSVRISQEISNSLLMLLDSLNVEDLE